MQFRVCLIMPVQEWHDFLSLVRKAMIGSRSPETWTAREMAATQATAELAVQEINRQIQSGDGGDRPVCLSAFDWAVLQGMLARLADDAGPESAQCVRHVLDIDDAILGSEHQRSMIGLLRSEEEIRSRIAELERDLAVQKDRLRSMERNRVRLHGRLHYVEVCRG